MNIFNPNARKYILMFAIILLVVATGLLVLHFFSINRPEGYADGIGIIDHIDTTWVGTLDDRTANHDYYVKYTYEGVEYISKLGNYSGFFEVGNEIHILINMKDPTIIQNLGTPEGNLSSMWGCIAVYIMGALFMALYIFLLVRDKRKIIA